MKKIIILFYCIILFPVIYILSSFKEESFIDGNEIKNACMAYKVFVVDDIRDFTVTLTLILLIPVFFYLKKTKFRDAKFTLLIIALLLYSLWRFYIRLNFCHI